MINLSDQSTSIWKYSIIELYSIKLVLTIGTGILQGRAHIG